MDTINIKNLIEFRKKLHKHPELSGIEIETAQKVKNKTLSYFALWLCCWW